MPKSNGKNQVASDKSHGPWLKLLLKITPLWVSPNMLSILRLAMIPVIVLALALGYFPAALALFIIAALLDKLDGTLARARQQQTDLGLLLDPLADKLLIMAVVALLLIYFPEKLLIIYVFIFDFLILLISALKVRQFKPDSALPIQAANIWGKSKMLTQVLGISLALLWLAWPIAPLLKVSELIIWLSLTFQITSAVTYSS